ncbi:MAG: acyl-CoA dehydrogenase [SAR86 cluster bacterium]|uniref:Acyl-CoA dehydrogenase n=1 Tax=SAR86 cluster bacterium TaxID=2030880 RepID=A0A368BRK9_9GAMM|nr:MAG: acyl-CoA dehydrogenase [SAR86 cluster bacterium]
MKIELTKNQQKLKDELKEYFSALLNKELLSEMIDPQFFEGGGPEFKKALKIMGQDGWIGLSWPKEFGGKEFTPIEQYIFVEEIMRTGFPFPFLTTESVGPMIAQYGSDWAKETIAKSILRGETIFAIGYSEPNAGTDLASLKTQAQSCKEGFKINGQKIWTSLANYADYIWLAARTNNEVKKHKGISMFIVPTDDDGFSYTPIQTLGDVTTNMTYYDDIYVSKDNLVGELNSGWNLITSQLNLERLALVNHGPVDELYNQLLSLAKSTKVDSTNVLSDIDWVKSNFAKIYSGLETLKLICWKQVWGMENNVLSMTDASLAKIYGSEYFIEAYRMMMEIFGELSIIRDDSLSILNSRLERMYRTASILTFGGGTNEVQRDIISMAGLLMPRSR